MKISCPRCKKPTEYNEQNPFRPFCGERCKLLDLGAWAMEKHAIPGDHAQLEDEKPSSDHDKNPEDQED